MPVPVPMPVSVPVPMPVPVRVRVRVRVRPRAGERPPGRPEEAVAQIRRQLREEVLGGGARDRLVVELPLPLPGREDDPYALLVPASRASAWFPGGVRQQLRALAPLVEAMLEGYGCAFQGYLGGAGAEGDAVGVWASGEDVGGAALTVVAMPGNDAFPDLASLVDGAPDGVRVMLVNPLYSGRPEDAGQLWERGVKAEARRVLGMGWEAVYVCRAVRTPYGMPGVLYKGSGDGPWEVYAADRDGPTTVVAEFHGPEPSAADIETALRVHYGPRYAPDPLSALRRAMRGD